MVNYRKIWESHYGEIPKDKFDRSFDIHHIDGNRKNNHINNLIALSLEDHWKIHFDKGEYAAANLIAKRLSKEMYSGYERPDHSIRMTGCLNPMFNKKGNNNPNFGKKRPSHSEWLKENGSGLSYKRNDLHIQNLKESRIGKVSCKDLKGNILIVSKQEFDSREDLFGISHNIDQIKLRKKVRCIEDDLIFNSLKEASKYYNDIGSPSIIKSIKNNIQVGIKKLGRSIKFEYVK